MVVWVCLFSPLTSLGKLQGQSVLPSSGQRVQAWGVSQPMSPQSPLGTLGACFGKVEECAQQIWSIYTEKSCRQHVTVVARGQKQPKIRSAAQSWLSLPWARSFMFKLTKSFLNKNVSTRLGTVMPRCIISSGLKKYPEMIFFFYGLMKRSSFSGAESWEQDSLGPGK